MRTFTVERGHDESGISGTGVVMEGVEFSDGRVVIRWNTDPCSVVHWASFQDFKTICIEGHPSNDTVVRWSDGKVWWQSPESGRNGTATGFEVEVPSTVSTRAVL